MRYSDTSWRAAWKVKTLKQSGFSLLELVLVIIFISILLAIAVDRLLKLQVDAERTSMEQTLGTLRSAMGIQVASHIVRGEERGLPAQQGANPMDWLSEKPKNYLGVLDDPLLEDVPVGNWYFDKDSKLLIYIVKNSGYFNSTLQGPARARFRVQLDFEDANRNGRFDPHEDQLSGLKLSSTEAYSWLNEPVAIKDFAVRP